MVYAHRDLLMRLMTETSSNMEKQKETAKKWYVIQAVAGQEKAVEQVLKERVAAVGLSSKVDDVLIPEEEVEELRAGKRYRSKRKFYPGYILVHMEVNHDTWHFIKDLPNVRGFIGGTPDSPMTMRDEEVESIRQKVREGGESPRPKTLYQVGTTVRITNGPFTDFHAMVEEANYEKSRLQVSVQVFGRFTPLELGFSDVEKT